MLEFLLDQTTSPAIPPGGKKLLYRGIDRQHDREDFGAWWTTHPYYALRYSQSGEGEMFVTYDDEEDLNQDANDASLEAEYQNFRFTNGAPTNTRRVTMDEIEKLLAATPKHPPLDDDFPGREGLVQWPENAIEIGNEIFLPTFLGSTALSENVSAEEHTVLEVFQPLNATEKLMNLDVEHSKRRVESMENTFRTISGLQLICPDKRVLEEITSHNEKIAYIDLSSGNVEVPAHKGATEFLYSKIVFETMLRHAEKELVPKGGSRPLAYRAIMASLNGSVDVDFKETSVIHDITQIAEQGVEKAHDIFNVAVANTKSGETSAIDLHRVNQYAAKIGFSRAVYMDTKAAESIFPVVLVYDTEMLKKAPGNVWAVQIREGHTAEEALLKAYILDCPVR